MNQLFKVHWMALHPIKVLSILAGIILSFFSIELAGRWGDIVPDSGPLVLRYFVIFENLVAGRHFVPLALVAVWMCFIWMTLGGAATRRMCLDLLGTRRENFWRTIRYCFKAPLLFPSALAVGCFYFILLARMFPWLLLFLLPMWLYAGLYYGALTLEDISLREAARRIHSELGRWQEFLKLQTSYLISFSMSTGLVYLIAIGYSVIVRLTVRQFEFQELFARFNLLEAIMITPVLLYALGYTTSNLKSLQVFLYLNIYLKEPTEWAKVQTRFIWSGT